MAPSAKIVDIDSDFLTTLEKFVTFDRSVDLRIIHELIGKDLDLQSISVQFNDLSHTNIVKELQLPQLVKHLCSAERFSDYREITVVLARILACTPHSADVERCVSANNLLKTPQR